MQQKELKGDNHIFVENKKRFIDEFSESEHNVVKLGLITIYYDFISYFDDKEYKVISKNAMSWVENSKRLDDTCSRFKTSRKIIQFRRNTEVKCYKYRKTVVMKEKH